MKNIRELNNLEYAKKMYPNVFSPFKIENKEIELPNKIVFPAWGVNFCEPPGEFTDKLIKFYEDLAKGGCGLVTTGVSLVTENSLTPGGTFYMRLYKNKYKGLKYKDKPIIENKWKSAHRKLFNIIKSHGSKAGLQIAHQGFNHPYPSFGYEALIGPSDITKYNVQMAKNLLKKNPGYKIKEMSEVEIENIIQDFIDTAVRAYKAGVDYIEFHAANGFLLHEFLSPRFNRRQDNYGGSVENRTKILTQIIKGTIKELNEIKNNYKNPVPLIGVRLAVTEFIEGGLIPEHYHEICPILEEAGVDIFHGSVGTTSETLDKNIPIAKYGDMPNADIIAEIKKINKLKKFPHVPLINVGSIMNLKNAEKLIKENKADLIALGRSLMADPDLVKLSANGKESEIRKCYRCNFCIKTKRQNEVFCKVNTDYMKITDYIKNLIQKLLNGEINELISDYLDENLVLEHIGPEGVLPSYGKYNNIAGFKKWLSTLSGNSEKLNFDTRFTTINKYNEKGDITVFLHVFEGWEKKSTGIKTFLENAIFIRIKKGIENNNGRKYRVKEIKILSNSSIAVMSIQGIKSKEYKYEFENTDYEADLNKMKINVLENHIKKKSLIKAVVIQVSDEIINNTLINIKNDLNNLKKNKDNLSISKEEINKIVETRFYRINKIVNKTIISKMLNKAIEDFENEFFKDLANDNIKKEDISQNIKKKFINEKKIIKELNKNINKEIKIMTKNGINEKRKYLEKFQEKNKIKNVVPAEIQSIIKKLLITAAYKVCENINNGNFKKIKNHLSSQDVKFIMAGPSKNAAAQTANNEKIIDIPFFGCFTAENELKKFIKYFSRILSISNINKNYITAENNKVDIFLTINIRKNKKMKSDAIFSFQFDNNGKISRLYIYCDNYTISGEYLKTNKQNFK